MIYAANKRKFNVICEAFIFLLIHVLLPSVVRIFTARASIIIFFMVGLLLAQNTNNDMKRMRYMYNYKGTNATSERMKLM